jgi:phage minor structural protein
MLVVTSLQGQTEALTDYKDLTRKRRVNGERSLSFLLFKTERNAHAFDLVQEESIIEYDGHKYRIKRMEERTIGGTPVKNVEAQHVFFDIIDDFQYETLSGKLNIVQALNHVFSVTDWTWVNQGAFDLVEFDSFGNDNALALFQTILERYEAEFDITGPRQVTLKNKIGVRRDTQFRYRHNIKTLSRNVDTSNLSTYIKGYGKKVEEKDILSGESKNLEDRTGTWEDTTDPYWYTKQVGATFKMIYTGTGIRFWYWSDDTGGVWEFTLDGDKKERVSTWNKTPTLKSVDLFRNAPEGNHTIVATFKGDDPNHLPSTGKNTAKGWVRCSSTGNEKTFDVYRLRKGDELYTCTAEYTSPNAAIFGIRHAKPYYDDKITNSAVLLEKLQRVINDEPEVSIEIEVAELLKNGVPLYEYELGDEIYLIYEPLNIDLIVRILEITDYPESNRSPSIVLGNVLKKASDYMASFSQVQKALKDITDNEGNLTLKLKRLYSDTNIYHDHTGSWYISPEDFNRFVHIGSGGIDVHRGLIRVERDDGYALITGGKLNVSFGLDSSDPFFLVDTSIVGRYFATNSTTGGICQVYTFTRQARYVVFEVVHYSQTGASVDIYLEQAGTDEILATASTTKTSVDDVGDAKNLVIDLGTPDGSTYAVYLKMKTSDPNCAAYGRVIRKYQTDFLPS